MAAGMDRGVPVSTLCPKFLHSNSTSHTWPFSAIAELIDNAYDPDVSATKFWIDKTVIGGEECLSFRDNGSGLDWETMHKMLSFGYSDKTAVNGVQPIGMYGNGFKSGSMRLGKDAIVLSKSKKTLCVGMLSQTYLEDIKAEQIIVPIVSFEKTDANTCQVRDEHKASLRDILRYSLFKSELDLLTEISTSIGSTSEQTTGTLILIWNLRRTSTRSLEFDFQKNRYDVQVPSDIYEALNQTPQSDSYVPDIVYSLRAYCSILYLKPRMQIIIRGQKVKSQLISKSLALMRKDHYKPSFHPRRIPIIFGYNPISKHLYGVMMYHKNRLIKAYEHVGCQLKADSKGVGVIGVVECNFLDPTHNKQSFIENDKYRKTITSLGIKLGEYWNEIRYRRTRNNPSSVPAEDDMTRPDQNWVQCDGCSKWRKLPDGIDCSKLPDTWSCHMNPDPQFRSCSVEEEPEDSDDDTPSYTKTYKQQERENKKKQEMKMAEEEQQRGKEQLAASPRPPMIQHNASSPSTAPVTPRSRFPQTPRIVSVRSESALPTSPAITQAACTPSNNRGLPIITDVCSLSNLVSRKRRLTDQVDPSPKTPKVNDVHRSAPGTPSVVSVTPQRSPAVSSADSEDTDDDLFILESASTPKPKTKGFDLSHVKVEGVEVHPNVGMLLECRDDAALGGASETKAERNLTATAAVGTDPPLEPLLENKSRTTQTEVRTIKREKDTENAGDEEPNSVKQTRDGSQNACVTQTLQNGLDIDREAGTHSKEPPLNFSSLNEVQEQQDQLLALMQATAQERDSLREQVHQLTCQLEDTRSRLQELSVKATKKECSHQATQTEDTEEEKDYRGLLERARQRVEELMSVAANGNAPCRSQWKQRSTDELVLQLDQLVHKLSERTEERDQLRLQVLHHQLDTLKEENPSSSNGVLMSDIQQEDSGAASSSGSSRSLIELRHNIGRFLIYLVPALDLNQVNYECNVIDEILEQALCDEKTLTVLETLSAAMDG